MYWNRRHVYVQNSLTKSNRFEEKRCTAHWCMLSLVTACYLNLWHRRHMMDYWALITMLQHKVKCSLVQALRLCIGRTAHRGNRGIALPFHDHGTRRGWGVSVTPRPLLTSGKDPVPIVQEAGWAPGPVLTGAENLAPHRDSIPGPSST